MNSLLLSLAVPILLGLTGAAWEAWQAAGERRRMARPGTLIAIGDRLLHAHLQGRRRGIAQPVVVLDGGLSNGSLAWPAVVRELGPDWLVLTYDRAGHLWSESITGPRDADANLEDLRHLLGALHLAPPWLLVAHSYSGHIARLHAIRHPEDIAGLVLVETTPGRLARLIAQSPFAKSLRWKLPAARIGLWRLIRMWQGLPPMPQEASAEGMAAGWTRLSQSAKDLAASRAELASFARDVEAVDAMPQPDQPCILLVSTQGAVVVPPGRSEAAAHAEVLDAQLNLAARLPRGEARLISNADHEVPWQAPAEVAQAIRDVAAHHAGRPPAGNT